MSAVEISRALTERLAYVELAPGTAYKQAAVEALRAILAIHQPQERRPVCGNAACLCGEPKVQCSCTAHHDDWPDAYPCETVRAAMTALGVAS